ncbi:MAG: hypothetical protein LHW41_02605 [Candidatus Cloacimonetes bacterium]|nr:hypothetical protein [Candidatus Cloacimonadota bacterium]
MKKLNSLVPILTLIAIILVSLSASCDKRNPPPILPAPPIPTPLSDVRIIHKMSASPDTIYADNNITYSTIKVEIRDGEGFGVPGQMVKFKTAPIGRVLADVATDSTGIATTVFWDDGQSGIATVTAIVRKFHETEKDSLISADTLSVQITVEQPPAVESVTLHFDNMQRPFPMKVAQTVPVYATALNALGDVVPDGTLITLECIKGKFVDQADNDLGKVVHRPTFNGRAAIFYNSGTSATTNPESVPEKVIARIGNVSDYRDIMIRPGTPFGIEIRSLVTVDGVEVEADTTHVGSQNQIFMESTLVDMYNNTVQGKNVKFTTDLGTFLNTTQSVNIQTNEFGVARVRFTPGLFAGAATIGASALNDTLQTSLIFNITSDQIHSIDFTQQDMITLNVANTGGLQSAVLRLKLRDINGNLIDKPQQVYFKIMNSPSSMPAGANLNNASPTDSVMVTSNGGEAQVSVNAGTVSGMLIIRASCTTEEGRYIQSTKPNIIIQSGPPHTIVPFISGFNTGVNMGGGVWRVVAGAHVRDRWQNPVQNATVVQFEIYGEGANADYKPYTAAQIQSGGSVGNSSVDGDTLVGVAFTTITYNGLMTNDKITIFARSGGEFGEPVDVYSEVVLPLNDPRLDIQVIPRFVNFGHTAPNTKEADISFYLTDGQGLDITGSEFLMYCDRGQIILHTDHYFPGNPGYVQNPPNYGDISHPELVTTYQGIGHSRIKVWRTEFQVGDDQLNIPSEKDVNITARLMGTNLINSTILSVYRYGGTAPF